MSANQTQKLDRIRRTVFNFVISESDREKEGDKRECKSERNDKERGKIGKRGRDTERARFSQQVRLHCKRATAANRGA